MTHEDKVFKAIERLLRTSGFECWNCTSVCDEVRNYTYKTLDGKVGVVSKEFINDRINSGLY